MQQHRKQFWTPLVVLCSLEQEVGTAVGTVLRGENFVIKAWNFLDLWCFQNNWNSEITRSNHDEVIELQVVSLERGFTIPSWMTVQHVLLNFQLVVFMSNGR